jgi:hypothetical protein
VGEDGTVNTSVDPALDLARRAAIEEAGADSVGDHVESVLEDEGVRTHYFGCASRGYQGWRWAVTVVELDGGITVSEVVLLPGGTAVLAPAWVPWQERVRPGDLGPGDLFPTAPQDPRLEPGYTGADALEEVDEPTSDLAPLRPEQWELGLGREVVLSAYGRDLAAERWAEGDFGPESAMAKAAPGSCGSCGFLLPIGGLVGQAFGVCAHEMGADGRVVALGYGCGAHSSVREIEGTGVPVTDIVVDELAFETVALDLTDGSDAASPGESGDEPVASLIGEPALLLDDDAEVIALDEVEGVDGTDLDTDENAETEPVLDDADGTTVDDVVAGPDSADSADSADDAEDDDSADSADGDDSPDADEDDDIVDLEPDEVLG